MWGPTGNIAEENLPGEPGIARNLNVHDEHIINLLSEAYMAPTLGE